MVNQLPHNNQLIGRYRLKPDTASTTILTSATLLQIEHKGAGSSPLQTSLNNMSVLLVEDNRANQMIAMELLECEGAIVTLAENGQQALELIKQGVNIFDVVLMDIQMPVMDGYQACREIRQTLGLQQLPIVAMSANAMQSDRNGAIAAGMNGYISKPFELSYLVEKLIQLCHWKHLKPTSSTRLNTNQNTSDQNKTAENALLNFEESLARFSGNIRVYHRALWVFMKDSQLLVATLPESLTGCNHADMLNSLHSIKGMAANLGAEAMAKLCKNMETDFALGKCKKFDQSNYQLDLAKLQSIILATCQLIQQKLTDSPITSKKIGNTMQKCELPTLLSRLAKLLSQSDLNALSLQQSLFDEFFHIKPDLFQLLDNKINQMKFVEAEKICHQISASLEY